MDGQKKLIPMDAMPVTRQKTKFISVLMALFVFMYGWAVSFSWAGKYTDSAHGDKIFGVKRSALSAYGRGNCGHCHLQHGSIEGQAIGPNSFGLFAPNYNTNVTESPYEASDNICFLCHGPSSYQSGGITNYDYSKTFGGSSFVTVNTIFDAFNLKNLYTNSSYHDLYDIYSFAKNQGWSFFKDKSNPCVACHNVHLAKLIKHNVQNAADYSAVSLPVSKNIGNRQEGHNTLWGDDTDERMSELYPSHYQAPFYYSSQSTYEPGGVSDYTGQKMPDYVTFCTACHNSTNEIYSTELGRYLRKIDWYTIMNDGDSAEVYSDKHGRNPASVIIYMKKPYVSTVGIGRDINFITSCTDCHEPHGSPNPFLLRSEVNGVIISQQINIDDNTIGYFCKACHKDDAALYGNSSLTNKWEGVHHIEYDAPYPGQHCKTCHDRGGGGMGGQTPIPCLKCHKHGYKDSLSGRICF